MSPCLRSISINASRPGKQPVSSNICFNMTCNFAAPKPGFDLRYSRAFSMMIDSMASSAKPSETLRLLYACRVKPNSPHRVPKPWLWHSVRSKLTVHILSNYHDTIIICKRVAIQLYLTDLKPTSVLIIHTFNFCLTYHCHFCLFLSDNLF